MCQDSEDEDQEEQENWAGARPKKKVDGGNGRGRGRAAARRPVKVEEVEGAELPQVREEEEAPKSRLARPRSRVSVTRSPSAIEISIPLVLEAASSADGEGGASRGFSQLQRSPSWENFSRAVREAATTFENKLAELYLRFGQEAEGDVTDFGSLESELMLGLEEAGSRASWEEETTSDLGEQAAAVTRWGAASAFSERTGEVPTRTEVVVEEDRESSSNARRLRPSPPPPAGLKRTASVKETARERSEYMLRPYTSMMHRPGGGSRSPLGRRRRHFTEDYPPIGVTRSQFFSFQPSEPIVPLDTSREREMISQVDDEIIDRRKTNRSLKVQNLLMSQPWRRRTVHSSQPYKPVANYHERRASRKGTEFSLVRPTNYPTAAYYRRSLEDLGAEGRGRGRKVAMASAEDLAGAIALSKYYKQPKYMKTIKIERFPH